MFPRRPSYPINQTAGGNLPSRIGHLKRPYDVTVVGLSVSMLLWQSRFEQTNYLPLDVVDRGRGKEQGTDCPANPT